MTSTQNIVVQQESPENEGNPKFQEPDSKSRNPTVISLNQAENRVQTNVDGGVVDRVTDGHSFFSPTPPPLHFHHMRRRL